MKTARRLAPFALAALALIALRALLTAHVAAGDPIVQILQHEDVVALLAVVLLVLVQLVTVILLPALACLVIAREVRRLFIARRKPSGPGRSSL